MTMAHTEVEPKQCGKLIGGGLASFPCGVELAPGESAHEGPCAAVEVPASMQRRAQFLNSTPEQREARERAGAEARATLGQFQGPAQTVVEKWGDSAPLSPTERATLGRAPGAVPIPATSPNASTLEALSRAKTVPEPPQAATPSGEPYAAADAAEIDASPVMPTQPGAVPGSLPAGLGTEIMPTSILDVIGAIESGASAMNAHALNAQNELDMLRETGIIVNRLAAELRERLT